LQIDKANKDVLIEQFGGIIKEFEKKEFKLKRTIVDKDIITNILNENIKTLEAKTKIIEEQIAFKEKLLANVNHELRTPLNAIIGMSSLLETTSLSQDQKKYTNIIKRSGTNLITIINDFLTLTSIKQGEFKLNLRPFYIHDLLNDFDTTFSSRIKYKGIEFRISVDYKIPKILVGDETRIYQVLQNLLTNAIKFTQKGKVELNIFVKEDLEEKKLIAFSIKDTGIGIPKEKQESIFDSFTQAHTAGNRDYMGTGLGLNIVKTLTNKMKGEISLKSEENVGTEICVFLPLEVGKEETQMLNASNSIINIPDVWKRKKFLMIEDNRANIFYSKQLFDKWALNITFKETYKEGLKEATENYYDLILSDLKLPDGNGIDLLTKIVSNNNSACNNSIFSVITASISEADKERASAIGIKAYIEKPFNPETLFKELQNLLGNNKVIVKDKVIIGDNENDLSQDCSIEKIKKQLNSISSELKVQLEFINIFTNQLKNEVDNKYCPQINFKYKNFKIRYLDFLSF